VTFEFAGGNVGVAAATNESVKKAQFSIMIYIYGAIILLILSVFRSFKAVAAIVSPLLVVSFVAYVVMSALGIGLKVNTLPVASLGAGIGVDYGLYIFSDLRTHLAHVSTFREAYLRALMVTGRAVVFTGVTLSFGVATWIFSDLQFQADVGLMLTFKFLLSMIVAVTVLPAIAVLVGVGRNERKQGHIAA
jgi:predicted RND superfamily exporter protein